MRWQLGLMYTEYSIFVFYTTLILELPPFH